MEILPLRVFEVKCEKVVLIFKSKKGNLTEVSPQGLHCLFLQLKIS